jgi:midasin
VISEYIVDQGRESGVSKNQCFFGRSSLPRTAEPLQASNSFVHTGSTVRTLEQVARAVSVEEPILLVGETGTGKTTVVQELAHMLGRKLHVFNMNQNTDSSDLLGGFKPVDLKYLITPLYSRFRELFCSLLNPDTPNNKQFLELLQRCYESNKINDFVKCLQHGMKSCRAKSQNPEIVDKLDR